MCEIDDEKALKKLFEVLSEGYAEENNSIENCHRCYNYRVVLLENRVDVINCDSEGEALITESYDVLNGKVRTIETDGALNYDFMTLEDIAISKIQFTGNEFIALPEG